MSDINETDLTVLSLEELNAVAQFLNSEINRIASVFDETPENSKKFKVLDAALDERLDAFNNIYEEISSRVDSIFNFAYDQEELSFFLDTCNDCC